MNLLRAAAVGAASTLALGLAVAAITAGAASADTTTAVTDVADSFVKSTAPSSNYGAGQQITADASPTTSGYFRFSVSVPSGQVITRAVFRCWAGSSNARGGTLRPVSSAWDERTITWANAPQPDLTAAPAGATGPIAAKSWARADVTPSIPGPGTYSFVLTTASGTAWSCASRENNGAHPPALDITTATKPATTASVTAPSSATPSTSSSSPSPSTTTSSSTTTPASSPSSTPAPSPTTSSTTSTPAPSPTTSSPTPVGSAHASMSLPARGTFYYPWFSEAWNQGAYNPATQYHPSAGYYATTSMLGSHVASLLYGGFDFAVSSWWGQGSKEDVRFAPLLTAAHGTPLMVAPYYEAEGNAIAGVAGSPDPTSAQITSDLDYLAAHYISDPNYLWVAGKPAIFVYGDPGDSCATATRWAQANAAATTRFYVVLKVFSGYGSCADQPANWHQYGPATASDGQGVHSYTISPGFYKFGESAPRLTRDPARWVQQVQAMNCSPAAFRLVTTFNEWGEGTAVESATAWASGSGQGTYLDTLHTYQTC